MTTKNKADVLPTLLSSMHTRDLDMSIKNIRALALEFLNFALDARHRDNPELTLESVFKDFIFVSGVDLRRPKLK